MIFVGEYLQVKSHQNAPGKFGKIQAKILRTPKNLPVPKPLMVAIGSEQVFKDFDYVTDILIVAGWTKNRKGEFVRRYDK